MDTTLKLPAICQDAHKYTRGSLLVLGGSRRYFGASVLCVLAAEKAGAGYVSLATPASAAGLARHHLVCTPVIEALEEGESGSMAAFALPDILKAAHRVDAICCGPGLTLTPQTIAFVGEVLRHAAYNNIPVLLDADALNALATEPTLLSQRGSQEYSLVLTPHAGELNRLSDALLARSAHGHDDALRKEPSLAECQTNTTGALASTNERGASSDEVQASTNERGASSGEYRANAAETLAQKLGAIVVAKGATTYIAGNGHLIESSEATPALAKAGTGDVLAGIISSFIAQGVPAREAAILGVRVHSKAGILAENTQGRRSVTALDVIAAIPGALKSTNL